MGDVHSHYSFSAALHNDVGPIPTTSGLHLSTPSHLLSDNFSLADSLNFLAEDGLNPGFGFGSPVMHHQRRRNHSFNSDRGHCLGRIRSSFSIIIHLRDRRTHTLQTSMCQLGILLRVSSALFRLRTCNIVWGFPAPKAHGNPAII